MRLTQSLSILLPLATQALASCEPEIPFHPPKYTPDSLSTVFNQVDASIQTLVAAGVFNNTSFSVQVASRDGPLHAIYHAGQDTANPVNGSSAYRVASNTKLFTALGILKEEAAGRLSLDDRITKFVPALRGVGNKIQWENITLRTLLAHLSGIPDNYAEDDLVLSLSDPTVVGLPPVTAEEKAALPTCEGFSDYETACSFADLLDWVEDATPVFPPKREASYSNVGFDLLGLVLANVSNTTYEQYVQRAILQPLNLTGSAFTPPATGIAIEDSYWGVDLGAGNPSGGLYSSANDMITFLRYALVHANSITPALNWFLPAAYSSGSHSYLGYPWEIFRSPAILPNSTRTVTMNTKGGGLTGYYSYSFILPVYDLVLFMGVAGDLTGLNDLLDEVVDPIVVGAETIAQKQLNATYAGTYVATDIGLNSSLTLSHSLQQSLYISEWVSNGTDVLAALVPLVANQAGTGDNIYFQIIPTFETRVAADGNVGEVWRLINVMNGNGGDTETRGNATSIWADYCVSNIDPLAYAGVALNEVVFWRAGNASAPVIEAELSAFRVLLAKE
ncbi:beta-lactamase/transpeptidase-like protein [Aspergillus sclerotioniger CBS 115572]|uniref:Beta-lactamase/transpeptidase-like protein n=1 Tax=Aspergillus sclerotioniger CBS 115572 TaxID=1450535 RepID=A0A317VIW2_9EURO|nr:beta-lactamase/transpeptidase-like protein [Aspergillus sclerotioniger CBS 115572]PWY71780.1 beta-lactamase/transpeptidase-like protein [Aspergillus sclerotioniger CBS 115572]